jgi:hypothetical protein
LRSQLPRAPGENCGLGREIARDNRELFPGRREAARGTLLP